MVKVSDIITLLRGYCGKNWSVDGAAALILAQDAARLPLPTFFVSLAPFAAIDMADYREAYLQGYSAGIDVILGFETGFTDRTGQSAQDFVQFARTFLWACLLNRQLLIYGQNGSSVLDTSMFRTEYVGDSFLTMDKARYWHKFQFKALGQIQPADGFLPDLSNLNSIYVEWDMVGADPHELPTMNDVILPPT